MLNSGLNYKKFGVIFVILLASFLCIEVKTEPWIDTRDAWLKADVEMLADIGIISVPVTTYPLMWSGIIKDIDNIDIKDIPAGYKPIFWRVKRAGKQSVSFNRKQQLRLSVANKEQVLRSFGDHSRTKAELSARRLGMNKHLAWNIEVTRQHDSYDGKTVHYNGSYIAGAIGNWIIGIGAVEKWWGAGWNSTNLLSNNARTPLGIFLQRNYSDTSDNLIFNWLGTWTLNTFVAQLDDQRTVSDAKLTGISFNFKPHRTLEIGVRATALWGGKNRNDSFDSLIDNFIGNQVCELQTSTECSDFYSDSGDRIAGVDFRWKLPVDYPISVYASAYGESETEFLPSKNITQYGITSSFNFLSNHWKWFVEKSDTILDRNKLNRVYESEIYQTGYRYYQRAIGSTYDNDSKVVSFGLLSNLNKQHRISLTYSNVELNKTKFFSHLESDFHSIAQTEQSFKKVKIDWKYKTVKFGYFIVSVDAADKIYDEFNRIDDKYRLSIDWFYYL